ncbi:MAG: hypothetical protein R3F02_04245 [Thiolinea sp.]
MKTAISSLVLTFGLVVAGQAAAENFICHSFVVDGQVYQQCEPEVVIAWETPEEVVTRTADPIYKQDSDGDVLAELQQSGWASRQQSGTISKDSWSHKTKTTRSHKVVETRYDTGDQ